MSHVLPAPEIGAPLPTEDAAWRTVEVPDPVPVVSAMIGLSGPGTVLVHAGAAHLISWPLLELWRVTSRECSQDPFAAPDGGSVLHQAAADGSIRAVVLPTEVLAQSGNGIAARLDVDGIVVQAADTEGEALRARSAVPAGRRALVVASPSSPSSPSSSPSSGRPSGRWRISLLGIDETTLTDCIRALLPGAEASVELERSIGSARLA